MVDQCSACLSVMRSLLLMLQLNMTAGRPLEAIEELADASARMAYLFTPQTDPDNFKHNIPHIAR